MVFSKLYANAIFSSNDKGKFWQNVKITAWIKGV